MSGRCDVCAKGPSFGHSVARLGRNAMKRRVKARTNRMFQPNIQSVRTTIGATPTRLRVCTSCIKKGSVLRQAR